MQERMKMSVLCCWEWNLFVVFVRKLVPFLAENLPYTTFILITVFVVSWMRKYKKYLSKFCVIKISLFNIPRIAHCVSCIIKLCGVVWFKTRTTFCAIWQGNIEMERERENFVRVHGNSSRKVLISRTLCLIISSTSTLIYLLVTLFKLLNWFLKISTDFFLISFCRVEMNKEEEYTSRILSNSLNFTE